MIKRLIFLTTTALIITTVFAGDRLTALSPQPFVKSDPYQEVVTVTVKGVPNTLTTQTKPPQAIIESGISYGSKAAQLEKTRSHLAKQYKLAQTHSQRTKVLNQARQAFITANTSLAPYWYGTPWSFHGTSQTPQQGSIACGYFVTTLLEDAGLKVQRAKLAQQASENIIKSLTTEKHIKRFHNTSLKEFVTTVDNWGAGLYVVGLDFHVGLIWHDGTTVHFIHSTYVHPKATFSELADQSPVLASSKYRVIGKISDDDQLIKKWLQKKDFVTKT